MQQNFSGGWSREFVSEVQIFGDRHLCIAIGGGGVARECGRRERFKS